MPISVGWLLILVIYFWLLRRFIFTFVHIGSNSVQHMKVYFSRPDILWKIRFLAVVCNIFNTQVFIPRNWRGNILIAVKNSISQRQPFIPGNRWKRHLSYDRQIGTYMVICKERLFGKRPWYVFLGLTVAEGDLRLLTYMQQGTYATIICMQFRCLGTWVKGAKFTKTQKPEHTFQCELRLWSGVLKLVPVVLRATSQI